MILAVYFAWFVFLVVLLDLVTGIQTPNWIIAAMALTYVTVLFLDRENITEIWAWVKTQASKYNSPR